MDVDEATTLHRRNSPANVKTSTEIPPSAERAPEKSWWFHWDVETSEWDILALSTSLKVLLYPA